MTSAMNELAKATSFAESSQSAALSALFWWIIPIVALFGAIIYVLWTTRFKTRYENRIDRSVDRFRKFQDSFNNENQNSKSNGKVREDHKDIKGEQSEGEKDSLNAR